MLAVSVLDAVPILSVTVKVAVQVDSLFAASMTCKVTVVTPRPTSVPAAGVWVICSGAEPVQSVATRPMVVKSGNGAWQTPSAKAPWLESQVVIGGGGLGVRQRGGVVTVGGHQAVGGEVGQRRLLEGFGKRRDVGGFRPRRCSDLIRHGKGGCAGRFIVRRVDDVQGHRGDAQADQRSGGGRLGDLQRGGAGTVGGHQADGGEVGQRRLADAIGKGALVGVASRDRRRGSGCSAAGRSRYSRWPPGRWW